MYESGKLPKEPYQVDKNLIDTVNREVLEEAGFNVLEWAKQEENTIVDEWQVIDFIDNQNLLSLVMRLRISSNKGMPKLRLKATGNEVLASAWVAKEKIDIDTKSIMFEENGKEKTIRLKPYDKVAETVSFLLSTPSVPRSI